MTDVLELTPRTIDMMFRSVAREQNQQAGIEDEVGEILDATEGRPAVDQRRASEADFAMFDSLHAESVEDRIERIRKAPQIPLT